MPHVFPHSRDDCQWLSPTWPRWYGPCSKSPIFGKLEDSCPADCWLQTWNICASLVIIPNMAGIHYLKPQTPLIGWEWQYLQISHIFHPVLPNIHLPRIPKKKTSPSWWEMCFCTSSSWRRSRCRSSARVDSSRRCCVCCFFLDGEAEVMARPWE